MRPSTFLRTRPALLSSGFLKTPIYVRVEPSTSTSLGGRRPREATLQRRSDGTTGRDGVQRSGEHLTPLCHLLHLTTSSESRTQTYTISAAMSTRGPRGRDARHRTLRLLAAGVSVQRDSQRCRSSKSHEALDVGRGRELVRSGGCARRCDVLHGPPRERSVGSPGLPQVPQSSCTSGIDLTSCPPAFDDNGAEPTACQMRDCDVQISTRPPSQMTHVTPRFRPRRTLAEIGGPGLDLGAAHRWQGIVAPGVAHSTRASLVHLRPPSALPTTARKDGSRARRAGSERLRHDVRSEANAHTSILPAPLLRSAPGSPTSKPRVSGCLHPFSSSLLIRSPFSPRLPIDFCAPVLPRRAAPH